jgi:hypothetical protein
VEKPQRSKEDQNIDPLTEDLQKNPFLLAAVKQKQEVLKDLNLRTKPGPNPKVQISC